MMITKGWIEREKGRFDEELRKNYEEAIANGEEAEMRAWIAVARR